MACPSGFSYTNRKNGDVVITHNAKMAATLRGRVAERFLSRVAQCEDQGLMARATGNYKRGNGRKVGEAFRIAL